MKKRIVLLIALAIFAMAFGVKANGSNNYYFPISYTYQTKWGAVSESAYATTKKYWNPKTPLGLNLYWKYIEISPGVYDWTDADNIVGDIENPYMIVVKASPHWTIGHDDPMCTLPGKYYWGDYIKMVELIADRYHPRYIGIWNEPDVYPSPFPKLLGCVEDASLYGEFVRYVYRSADLDNTKILMGNVSMDGLPFLQEALLASMGSFDAVGFHCYAYLINGDYLSNCQNIYTFVKTIVGSNKTIMMTETAVIFKSGTQQQYQDAQILHFEALKNIDIVKLWYTAGGNGWPKEMPTDMYPNPVWYIYMGLEEIDPYP